MFKHLCQSWDWRLGGYLSKIRLCKKYWLHLKFESDGLMRHDTFQFYHSACNVCTDNQIWRTVKIKLLYEVRYCFDNGCANVFTNNQSTHLSLVIMYEINKSRTQELVSFVLWMKILWLTRVLCLFW